MLLLPGHQTRVRALAYSPDGTVLASGGADGTVRLWDLAEGTERRTLSASRFPVLGVAWSLDGTSILATDHDQSIRAWDARSGEPRGIFRRSAEEGAAVIRLILGGSAESPVEPKRLGLAEAAGWRISHARACSWWVPVMGQFGHSAAFEAHQLALSFPHEAHAELIHPKSGRIDHHFLIPTTANGTRLGTYIPGSGISRNHSGDVGAATPPDGRTWALTCGTTIELWDPEEQRLRILDGHRKPVRSLAFVPDGLTLASGGHDGLVCLWDVVKPLPPPQRPRKGGQDVLTWQWGVARDGDPSRFDWEIGMIDAVAFSPDGSTIAAGGRTGIVVWDMVEEHWR